VAGVAGDQRKLAVGAGEDLVEVALREHRQGMVEALAAGLWAAAVEQLQQRLAVPWPQVGGDDAGQPLGRGRGTVRRRLDQDV
jgi:hypothetical protein